MTARLQKSQTSKQRHHPIHLTCLLGLGWKTSKQREPKWMICFYLIEFWSRVMRTRRAEGKKNREKRRETREIEWGRKGGRVGEARYFTAVWKIWLTWGCPTLQETSNSGERERQTRAMVWGWRVEDVENQGGGGGEERAESRVCVSGGAVWG